MSDYMPTTEEVRGEYAQSLAQATFYAEEEWLAKFDRWLSEHDRQVAERAWDEGHKVPWRRGPDDCHCSAWSSSECACGKYGNGELLSLNFNPYRSTDEKEN